MFSLRIVLIVVMSVSVVVSLVVQEKKVVGSEETNVLQVRTQGVPVWWKAKMANFLNSNMIGSGN